MVEECHLAPISGSWAQQAQSARLREFGLNTDGEFERSLGRRLVESLPDA